MKQDSKGNVQTSTRPSWDERGGGRVFKYRRTIMSPEKTYRHRCPECKDETLYVPNYSRPMQIALRIWQIVIFFVSFGMLYPHTFSTDDTFAAKCTKCGFKDAIAYGTTTGIKEG
jgi:hypothetical protein